MPWPFNDKDDKKESDVRQFKDMDNTQMKCPECGVKQTFWKARVKNAVWTCSRCGHQKV